MGQMEEQAILESAFWSWKKDPSLLKNLIVHSIWSLEKIKWNIYICAAETSTNGAHESPQILTYLILIRICCNHKYCWVWPPPVVTSGTRRKRSWSSPPFVPPNSIMSCIIAGLGAVHCSRQGRSPQCAHESTLLQLLTAALSSSLKSQN